jgi:DNA replication protein DnaC
VRREQAPEPGAVCVSGVCDGSGWIVDDDNLARPCECREIRINRMNSRRLGTGVPKKFRGVSFERKPICDLDPRLLSEVRRFVDRIDDHLSSGRGLWFYGDVGTGKTSLAMLVSKAAIDRGHSVAIYSVPHLLADIKETYEEGSGRSYMELFRRVCGVDLLHLDDLGTEKRTEWVLEQLYSIVNERWQNERSIILTSNITDFDELREQVGTRTVSRLTEICGEDRIIPIMGRDFRTVSSP